MPKLEEKDRIFFQDMYNDCVELTDRYLPGNYQNAREEEWEFAKVLLSFKVALCDLSLDCAFSEGVLDDAAKKVQSGTHELLEKFTLFQSSSRNSSFFSEASLLDSMIRRHGGDRAQAEECISRLLPKLNRIANDNEIQNLLERLRKDNTSTIPAEPVNRMH